MRYTLPITVVLAALCSAPARAQSTEPPTSSPPKQTVSVNPFGLLFEWYNIEFERQVSPAVTIGGAAAVNTLGEYSNVDFIARFYPQGKALRGFYLGARGGGVGVEIRKYQFQPLPPPPPGNPTRGVPVYPTFTEETRIVPAFGLEVGYNWLLGRNERVSIGLGFGLSRLLDEPDGEFYMPVLPHFRIVNVGVAF
jgi:hypothetical protein